MMTTCVAAEATDLKISDISSGTNGIVVSWQSRIGGQYRVDHAVGLTGAWSKGQSLAALTNFMLFVDHESAFSTSRFYRLAIERVPVERVRHWAYVIQDLDAPERREELVGTHYDMYVLEPTVTERGNESFDIAGLVRDIRNHVISNYHKNPLILAYVDIGQAEDWRWYWQAGWAVGNPDWIVGSDPDGWTGCYTVAYWRPEWHDIVIFGTNGRSHIEETLKAGFDGVYMDWLDAFSDPAVVAKAATENTNTAAAMFDFVEKIRTYARETSSNANHDYMIVAQNAADLYQENPSRYEQLIDAIAVEGIWYDGDDGFDDWNHPRGYNVPTDEIYPGWTAEVLSYLEPMKGRLPIFCCEYAQDINGTNLASMVYTNLAVQNGFIPYCTRRSLQRLSKTPYPVNYFPFDY